MNAIPDQSIPKPTGALPGLGHLRLLDSEAPVQSLMDLAKTMGEIYALEFPGGGELVVVSSARLVDELSDEARFDKKVSGALHNIRDIALDGLFTAHTNEPNWSKAHQVLMPAFSQGAMANYFPVMLDVVLQLLNRWRARNASDAIDVPDDMVRLTLETIGLCGFDFHFGSFAQERPHSFVESMLVALQEALDRSVSVPLLHDVNWLRRRRYESHVENLTSVVDRVIAERKTRGPQDDDRDLLSLMLSGGSDRLSDENIRYQIITFLIAGHETTSGLMSFALYFLLKHPAVMRLAVAEADQVLGDSADEATSLAQVGQLRYLRQVLNEALRLYPPAPAFTLMPREDCLLGERYALRARQPILVLAGSLHRDSQAWGENAELFDPEHFSPAAEAAQAPNSFKPFGNGQRACIGRQFALQEAVLALGLILKNFRLVDVDNYALRIKETLTIKPDGLRVQVRARSQADRTPVVADVTQSATTASAADAQVMAEHHTPMLVLYGSNMGSAEQVAMRLADEAEARGYASRVAELDAAVGALPNDGVVVLISASYNGQPPDNAAAFVTWLAAETLDLSDVRYAVFGLGNRDWATTYQHIPRLLDSELSRHGANALLPRGEADARGDFYGAVDDYLGALWPQLAASLNLALATPVDLGPRLSLQSLSLERSSVLAAQAHELQAMQVLHVQDLVTPKHGITGAKRVIRLQLPKGVTYKTGDHLLVMPRNTSELVRRVGQRFGALGLGAAGDIALDELAMVKLNHGDAGALPVSAPVTLQSLLHNHFELQAPATRRQLEYLAAATDCPPDQAALQRLSTDTQAYADEVLTPRLSLLDLLERFPSCDVDLDWYLSALAELHPRYYSIASSHLCQPDAVDIVVSVVDEPHWAREFGASERYNGACSALFAQLQADDSLNARVRAVESNFLPPQDLSTPVLMIGPGTGVAPFLGFMRDRIYHRDQGRELGPAHLIFGCRHPEVDFLYEQEMGQWAAAQLCEVHTAFSRQADAPHQYVQHVVAAQAEMVWALLQGGPHRERGIIYVCGDAQAMLSGVREALQQIYIDHSGQPATVTQGDGPHSAQRWVLQLETQGQLRIDAWS